MKLAGSIIILWGSCSIILQRTGPGDLSIKTERVRLIFFQFSNIQSTATPINGVTFREL